MLSPLIKLNKQCSECVTWRTSRVYTDPPTAASAAHSIIQRNLLTMVRAGAGAAGTDGRMWWRKELFRCDVLFLSFGHEKCCSVVQRVRQRVRLLAFPNTHPVTLIIWIVNKHRRAASHSINKQCKFTHAGRFYPSLFVNEDCLRFRSQYRL